MGRPIVRILLTYSIQARLTSAVGSCDCSFRSEALDTMIQSINELTFLTATGMVNTTTFKGLPRKSQAFPSALPSTQITAVDSNTTTSFRASSGEAVQLQDVTHYKTHYVYAGIAFGITMLCIILVIPSYWHYGELGRRVTLGPVEIASAFGAPILVDNNQNIEARKENIDSLIKHIGKRKIVYGFVDVDHDGVPDYQEMQLADSGPAGADVSSAPISPRPQSTVSPIASPVLNQGDDSKVQKRRSVRLAMGPPEQVRPTSQLYPMRSPTMPMRSPTMR